MEFLRNLGPCIDLECSGKGISVNSIYRVFNSMFELRAHHRRHHKNNIRKYSILIKPKINNNNYRLILSKNGNCEEHYYIEEKYLIENDLILPYDEFIKMKKKKLKRLKKKKKI